MTRAMVAARPRDEAADDNGQGGDFAITRVPEREAMVEVASSRAANEIQAAMVVAKRFPRDEQKAFQRIMQACKRKSLAEQAVYEYPRGGETVTGPSIRLAEAMAQAWGNLDFGIIELEQRAGESTVMAYAWDLETNTRQTKVFTVKHERHTRTKTYSLTDPRDIYEMAANQGARRMRACILGVIPGDVTDAAIKECDDTMRGNNQEPLADRVRKMIPAYADLGVTQDMLEKKLSRKLDSMTEREYLRLRKLYASIKDGMVSVDKVFEVPGANVTDLNERMKRGDDQRTPGTDAEGSQLPAEEQAARKSPLVNLTATTHPPQAGSTATEPDVQGVTDSDVEPPPDAKPAPLAFPDRCTELQIVGIAAASAPEGMDPNDAKVRFRNWLRLATSKAWRKMSRDEQRRVFDFLTGGKFDWNPVEGAKPPAI